MASKLFKPRTYTAEQMAERVAAAGYIDGRFDALQARLERLEAIVAEWQASERAVSASALIALADRLESLEGPVRAVVEHLKATGHVTTQRP